MSELPSSKRTQVQRIPDRGRYDAETIHAILDAAFVCHVGFVVDGQPFVIPTNFARDGEKLYLHGSSASRMSADHPVAARVNRDASLSCRARGSDVPA